MDSQPQLAQQPSRLIGLDLLRLLAIALVLGRHMEPVPSDVNWLFKPVLDAWRNNGWLGVDLFFVLSGFLVSGLLFAEYRLHGSISVKRFYIRRAWRIYPAFFFLIGLTYLYSLFVLGREPLDRRTLTEIFFLQSYRRGFWNHTWSLAVEEHFYFVLPLLLLLLVRRNRGAVNPFRAVPYLVAATSAICLAARIINFTMRTDYSFYTHAFPTHLRIDSLFFGVAIAYVYYFHAEWFRRMFYPRRFIILAQESLYLDQLSFYRRSKVFMSAPSASLSTALVPLR